ncbi:MAG: hypothetical protein FJX29_04945 [Alphaproteobacteria bacterium]|nr:hypothetical protein [Alphaproteobacteria bacterium]
MDDMNARERILKQDVLIVGIVGLSVLNGMHFSPWLDIAFILTRPFFQVTFFISSPLLVFYFTSLALSTLTIMLAGIPAAIFERLTGRKETDATSLYIWLGAMILLTMPALLRAGETFNPRG